MESGELVSASIKIVTGRIPFRKESNS